MNRIIALLPTELHADGNVPCKGTELTEATRDFTETFHCRATELSTLLAHIREEGAVLLFLSIECQSDFTLTVRRNNFSRMNPKEQNEG